MIKENEKQNNYDAAIQLLVVMVRQYIEKHKDEPRCKDDDKQAFNRVIGKKMAERRILKSKQRISGHKNSVNGYEDISLRTENRQDD